MPTPARRAISSSGASRPCSANTSRAASSSATRLRSASTRSRRGVPLAHAAPSGLSAASGLAGAVGLVGASIDLMVDVEGILRKLLGCSGNPPPHERRLRQWPAPCAPETENATWRPTPTAGSLPCGTPTTRCARSPGWRACAWPEHAIHSWDVAVALDPSAKVAPEAAGLLIDTIGQLTARAGQPDANKRRVHVSADDPQRHFTLETGDTVTLEPAAAEERDEGGPELRLPAEALVRLVYGRLDPAHTPPVEARGVDLDELRPIFPGF